MAEANPEPEPELDGGASAEEVAAAAQNLLDLAALDGDIHQRRRGHVTLENVYVVALVSAWASVILLVCIYLLCLSSHHSRMVVQSKIHEY